MVWLDCFLVVRFSLHRVARFLTLVKTRHNFHFSVWNNSWRGFSVREYSVYMYVGMVQMVGKGYVVFIIYLWLISLRYREYWFIEALISIEIRIWWVINICFLYLNLYSASSVVLMNLDFIHIFYCYVLLGSFLYFSYRSGGSEIHGVGSSMGSCAYSCVYIWCVVSSSIHICKVHSEVVQRTTYRHYLAAVSSRRLLRHNHALNSRYSLSLLLAW